MTLHPKTQEAYRLLHEGALAFAKAERQGIRLDIKYTKRKIFQLSKEIKKTEDKFFSTKFAKSWIKSNNGRIPNYMSDVQLSNYLYIKRKLEPKKLTKTGKGSADDEALKALNIPALDVLLRIRKLKKIKDTYLKGFLNEEVNGYIHPFFNLNTARTFRSSSNSPNFQNLPKRDDEAMNICRGALLPRPNHQLMEVDYSGIEVRVAACYHEDENMMKYLNDPTSDMHRDMAMQIFKMKKLEKEKSYYNTLRQAAKNGFVFPEFYGDYYKKCAESLSEWVGLPLTSWKQGMGIEIEKYNISDHMIKNGLKSFKLFVEHMKDIEIDFWENRFPQYAQWKERWWKMYQKYGYIDMKTGFRCSGVMGRNDTINYPVQGAAFHCLLWSFIEVSKNLEWKGFDTKLIGQIHDSMVLDVLPEEKEKVIELIKDVTCKKLMEHWKWIIVPMDVDFEICEVDRPWSEKKKIE